MSSKNSSKLNVPEAKAVRGGDAPDGRIQYGASVGA